MNILRNQKGVISLFVIFAMLFLLVFSFGIYSVIISKIKINDLENIELKEIYSKKNEAYTYAENDEIVPIYNINELNIVGSGKYVNIKEKLYQCSRGKSYVLKNNIIIDIEEDLKSRVIGFNDYKLFLSSYFIDKSNYDIFYYERESKCYWKNLAYQKFDAKNKEFISSTSYLENSFCIVEEYEYQPINNKLTFMLIWSNENGELNNVMIETQDITQVTSLNQINVFNKNYSKINKENGEYYLFINLGEKI